MAAYQFSKRRLTIVLLLTLLATWVPPAHAVTPPVARPDASDILLDVAAHSPGLLIRLNTYEDIEKLSIDPYVRVHMYYAIAYGSWILTTRVPVTSGRWTGRPWLAIGGHARYFYFAYEQPCCRDPFDGSDTGGNLGGVVGMADGEAVSDFGKELTDIGMGIAAIGTARGNKGVTATGLGIAGIGMAINAIGLGLKIAEDIAAPPSPKQGHVDPTGMPAPGGPPGSDPNGPTGQSPPGIGVNGNGNSPSGGISGTGGDGEGGVGDPGDD